MRTTKSVLAVLAAALSFASAARYLDAACSPYSSLLCVSSDASVVALCASAFAAESITQTVTGTATVVETHTTSYTDVTSQVTVSKIKSNLYTTTITTTPLSTDTTFVTNVETTSTTHTSYTSATTAVTSAAANRRRHATCDSAAGYGSLSGLSTLELSTACSCLGDLPTTTQTLTIASGTVTSTSTCVKGLAPTTTISFIENMSRTYTVTMPAPTQSITVTTSTVTKTSIVSLAAPSFTHVWGPEAGCADVGTGPAQQLAYEVTSLAHATTHCEELCSQLGTCAAVYVQHMFTHYGTVKPYFQCYFNPKPLNATRDLKCGNAVGVHGIAQGFDAVGRGTA